MTTPDFEPPLPAFDMLEKPYEKTPLEWAHEIVPAGFAGPVWNGIRAGIAAAIADVRQELIKHQANEITRLANEQASKIGAKVKEAVEAKVLASLSLPSDVKICFTILEGVNPPATATDGRVNDVRKLCEERGAERVTVLPRLQANPLPERIMKAPVRTEDLRATVLALVEESTGNAKDDLRAFVTEVMDEEGI